MRYAILSDLHANAQAWTAVKRDFEAQGVDAVLCLGDVVGYGPEPSRVLEEVYALCHNFVLGNHDAVICNKIDSDIFNDEAKFTIEWTRKRLNDGAARFFGEVPMTLDGGNFLLSHAEIAHPDRFDYIYEPSEAAEHFAACHHPLLFIGHTHFPCAIYAGQNGTSGYLPNEDLALNPENRYLINVGSVGDPRNGDTRAHYVIYDAERGQVFFRKVPFDVEAYRRALLQSQLPTRPILFDYLGSPIPEKASAEPARAQRGTQALTDTQRLTRVSSTPARREHTAVTISPTSRRESTTFRNLQASQQQAKKKNRAILASVMTAVGLTLVGGLAWFLFGPHGPTRSTEPRPPDIAVTNDRDRTALPKTGSSLPVLPLQAHAAWDFDDPAPLQFHPRGVLAPQEMHIREVDLATDATGNHSLELSRQNSHIRLITPYPLTLSPAESFVFTFRFNHDDLDGCLFWKWATSPYPPYNAAFSVKLHHSKIHWELYDPESGFSVLSAPTPKGKWTHVTLINRYGTPEILIDGTPCETTAHPRTEGLLTPPQSPYLTSFRIGGGQNYPAAIGLLDDIQLYRFIPSDDFLKALATREIPHLNFQHAAVTPTTEQREAWDLLNTHWKTWSSQDPSATYTPLAPLPTRVPAMLEPLQQALATRRESHRLRALDTTRIRLAKYNDKLPLTTSLDDIDKLLSQEAAPFQQDLAPLRRQLADSFLQRVLSKRSPLVPNVSPALLDLGEKTAKTLILAEQQDVRPQLKMLFEHSVAAAPALTREEAFDRLRREAVSISKMSEWIAESFSAEIGVEQTLRLVDRVITGVVRKVDGVHLETLVHRPGGIRATETFSYAQLHPLEKLERLPNTTDPATDAMRGILRAAAGQAGSTEAFEGLGELLGLHLMREAPRARTTKAQAFLARIRERFSLNPTDTPEERWQKLAGPLSPQRVQSMRKVHSDFINRFGREALPPEDQTLIDTLLAITRSLPLPPQRQLQLAASFQPASFAQKGDDSYLKAFPRGALKLEHPKNTLPFTLSQRGLLARFDEGRYFSTPLPRSLQNMPMTLFFWAEVERKQGPLPNMALFDFYSDDKSERYNKLQLSPAYPGYWRIVHNGPDGQQVTVQTPVRVLRGHPQFHFVTVDQKGTFNWWIDGFPIVKNHGLPPPTFNQLLIGARYDASAGSVAAGTRFSGWINDLQIYDRLWSDSERDSLFRYLKEREKLITTQLANDTSGVYLFIPSDP